MNARERRFFWFNCMAIYIFKKEVLLRLRYSLRRGEREREREREREKQLEMPTKKGNYFVFVFSWLYKASRAMKAAKKVAARTRTEDGALSGDAVPVQMREGPAEPATTAMPDGGLVWQLSPPELVPDEQLS